MKTKARWINIFLILILAIQFIFFVSRKNIVPTHPVETSKGKSRVIVPTLIANSPSTSRISERLTIQDRCFRTVIPEKKKQVSPPTIVQQNAQNPQVHYYVIGKMTDEKGITRFFVKQKENGRIMQAREDGSVENGVSVQLRQDGVRCVTVNGVDCILQGAAN